VYKSALEVRLKYFGGKNLAVALAHEDLAYATYVFEYSSGKFQVYSVGTVVCSKFLAYRNPAYLVRSPVFHVPGRLPRPIPIIGFARTRPPLLGGVTAVKREIMYLRVVEGGLFPFAKADC
jgi:hypothetical protein